MPIMPGAMTGMMLGTDSTVLRAADRGEKARVRQILEHVLPVSSRYAGMQFDIKTAATREPYAIEKIACPVLTISAEDDTFGTASRAKYIATGVPDGRAILFATGGHALVGHYANALRDSRSFLQAALSKAHDQYMANGAHLNLGPENNPLRDPRVRQGEPMQDAVKTSSGPWPRRVKRRR